MLQEDGSGSVEDQQDEVEQLRAEIKELQETVESANKDLHLAEAHATQMQERCGTVTEPKFVVECSRSFTHGGRYLQCSLQEHERSKETMAEMLKQKLLTFQQAQETLEADFREIRSERDQALSGTDPPPPKFLSVVFSSSAPPLADSHALRYWKVGN